MLLEADGIVKRYPGVVALDGVSVAIDGGVIHAIVGENGAGKSTLMKVLSGAARPDSGTLRVDGVPVAFASPRDAQDRGIRMIHQELSLVPELTAADNIVLGDEPSHRGVIDRAAQRERATEVLARLGHSIDLAMPVARLSLAQRQMTEIAKAVARRAEVLILDEPTAILSQHETDALFALLRQLRGEGVAIAYISHRMDEVFAIADSITVLRDGNLVATAAKDAVDRREVVRQMVGRELAEGFPAPEAPAGDVALELTGLSAGLARDVSLTVRRGEIVALAGLVGAGRTDVARAIFGAERPRSGAMRLFGAGYAPRSPRDAIAAGVGLLPEDRKGQGLVLGAAIRDNITLATLDEVSSGGVIRRAAERAAAERWVDGLAIRIASLLSPVSSLSGGNQQKVVLARWMLANSRLLLFDEPTRGVDVGAKAEIYALMRRLTAGGVAIVMISSELPEALGMADRVIVMRDGRSVADLSGDAATSEEVARLILGERAA
ncbi:MAG: sugar ABC transporter ATP-binding protein [Gemmatimonadales bacterium]